MEICTGFFCRLYLHTVSQPVRIPKELAAYTLTLCFHLTLNDLEEIFLSRFMIKEKPHIDAEQYTLLQVCLCFEIEGRSKRRFLCRKKWIR